eukprot:6420775-Prymnesium_polylepis.1
MGPVRGTAAGALGFAQPSGHVGACAAGRPAFRHGARPQPTPSRAASRTWVPQNSCRMRVTCRAPA